MAILNVSSYITSAGLQAVTSAGAIGPYFAVKYFVPFYDARIDSSISLGHSAFTSALNISALNLTSATAATLVGEKIFASSAANYTLSNADYFYQQVGMSNILDGATGTFNTKQESQARVNLLLGKPLSQVVSASSVSPTTTIGSYTLTNAYNLSGTRLASYNPISATPYPTSAFYRVQSYSPKAVGSTSAVGTYKCRIPSGVGSFKFNGMALFVNKVDHYGFDAVGSSPVLFAVVLFDKPQIKSSNVGGVNSFEVDVDLGFDWNSLSGGTGNTPIYVETNYWTKVPTTSNTSAYALNYDGDVVISSSAAPGSWVPKSKLTIVDPEKSQLRLSFDGGTFDRYTDIRQKRRNFSTAGEIGIYNNTMDIGVLSLDTNCATDSLLEIGTNVKSMTIKSITMGVNVSAFNLINTHDSSNIGHSFNFTYASNTIVGGHQNTTFGNAVSAYGRYNFVFANKSFVGSKPGEVIFLDDETRGYNFVFGKNVSAYSLPNDPSQPTSDYFTDPLSNTTIRGGNVVLGSDIYAEGGMTLTVGKALTTSAMGAVNIGSNNINGGAFSLIQGYYNKSSSHGATVFGYNNSIVKTNAFSLIHGTSNLINANNDYPEDYFSHNYILGSQNTLSNGRMSLVVGYQNNTSKLAHTFLFGYRNTSNNSNYEGATNNNDSGYNLVFGYVNTTTSIGSSILGSNNTNNGTWSTIIGVNNVVAKNSPNCQVFGYGNNAGAPETYILGTTNNSIAFRSVAIGFENTLDAGQYSFAIGNSNTSHKDYSLSIGNNNINDGLYSITLGNTLTADHNRSIVIGDTAISTQANQVYIGGDNIDNITLKANSIKFIGDMAEEPSYSYSFSQSQSVTTAQGNATIDPGQVPLTIKLTIFRAYGYNSIGRSLNLVANTETQLSVVEGSGAPSTYYIYNSGVFSDNKFNIYVNRTNLSIIICAEGDLQAALLASPLIDKDPNNYHRFIQALLQKFMNKPDGADEIKIYEINNKTIGLNLESTNIMVGQGIKLQRYVKFFTNTNNPFAINATTTMSNNSRAGASSTTIRLVQGNIENGVGDSELSSSIYSSPNNSFHYVATKFFLSRTL